MNYKWGSLCVYSRHLTTPVFCMQVFSKCSHFLTTEGPTFIKLTQIIIRPKLNQTIILLIGIFPVYLHVSIFFFKLLRWITIKWYGMSTLSYFAHPTHYDMKRLCDIDLRLASTRFRRWRGRASIWQHYKWTLSITVRPWFDSVSKTTDLTI